MHFIVMTSSDGTIVSLSDAASRFLLYDSCEAQNKHVSMLLPDIESHRDASDRFETVCIGKNGGKMRVSCQADRVVIGNEERVAYTLSELVGSELLEAKAEKLDLELQRSREEVLSFTYTVSHDLRAPLVNIRGFSKELKNSLEDLVQLCDECGASFPEEKLQRLNEIINDDIGECFSYIDSSVMRMERLIEAILLLSRLGHRQLELDVVDTLGVVKEIVSSLKHQIDTNGIRVSFGALPPVKADRTALEQIFGNLIDNAVKYMAPGRAGELAIYAEAGDDETLFHVKDNGRGIEPQHITKVFEIFQRVGDNENVPGDGMGLSYVKTLVQRHGGRIWCESEIGKGSVFTVALPKR